MRCGCAANAVLGSRDGVKFDPPPPYCATHSEIVPAEIQPSLEGRMAECSCGKTAPSSPALAFFEYRGLGSESAEKSCEVCRYNLVVHDPEYRKTLVGGGPKWTEHEFIPVGDRQDIYYCGCRGWD